MSAAPAASPEWPHRFVPATGADARSATTLLLLHGTGGNEDSMLSLAREVAPPGTCHLLSPRGPVLERGMPRFFRRLAEGIFDEPDLIRRAGELASFVATMTARHALDPRRVVALGYSNGANIAAALLLLHPGTLAGAALLRAMVPLQPPTLPALAGTPVFLGAGEHDPIVPAENSARLAAMLRQGGADVTEVTQEAGHELTRGDLVALKQWLAPWLTPSSR